MKKVTIAVDPGVNGAIAIIYSTGKPYHYNAPKSFSGCVTILRELAEDIAEFKYTLYVERQTPFSCDKGAQWKLAQSYFSWLNAAECADLSAITVTPQFWQKRFTNCVAELPKGRTAKAARKKAVLTAMRELYPETKITLRNADALALAYVMHCEYSGVWPQINGDSDD